MIIAADNQNEEDKKLEKLELKNIDEMILLERLIVLLEDIKNIENSNLNYIKNILDEVEFNSELIIGNLGNICKSYFETYIETKEKQTENLNQLIKIMKLKSYSKSTNKNEEFVIAFNEIKASNLGNKTSNENFLYRNDVYEIIENLPLLNQFNNEFINIYENCINKKLNDLKEMNEFKELDLLKEVKEEKTIFEEKLQNICKVGIECNEFKEVKNILINDNSDEQHKASWMLNYLNKNRSVLSSVGQNVFISLKELFGVVLDKISEKKIYSSLDLCIILLQTFGTKKDNNNYLLEEEFKNKEIFQNEEIWKSIIIQKIDELIENINIERKEDIGSTDYINYVKENIEPILLSFIFSMKDFNVSDVMKKKVIEDICQNDKIKQYNFNANNLITFS